MLQKLLKVLGEEMLGIGINNHINGIENFWGLCKVRLSRFRGIKKDHFYCIQRNVSLGSITEVKIYIKFI